jgi:hypothetical protein
MDKKKKKVREYMKYSEYWLGSKAEIKVKPLKG